MSRKSQSHKKDNIREASYGSWKSPITSDLIVSETVHLSELAVNGKDLYWLEQRPWEGGRSVLVRRSGAGRPIDLIPDPFNVRSRVHEYGGGSWTNGKGEIYFSNFRDQRIYRVRPGEDPDPITPAANLRYADGIVDTDRNRLVCIREDHTVAGREAVNSIVSLDLTGERGARILVQGCDFYAYPRLSPDGKQLVWISWNHPDMPWDNTELWIASFDEEGFLEEPEKITGGNNESILQPEWSPQGNLYYLSDKSGWWNLNRIVNGETEKVVPMDAEFGQPLWCLGTSTYAFESPGRIVCCYSQRGSSYLAEIDTVTMQLTRLEVPHTQISNIRTVEGKIYYIGSSSTAPPAIIEYQLGQRKWDVIRSANEVPVDLEYFSVPMAIEFPAKTGQNAYGFYYPPRNPDFVAPEEERPPLMVRCHGGPTSQASCGLNLGIQFWTSRGFSVLDVNYSGSTGYGRAYRDRLLGQWGVADVEDCIAAAHYLVQRGEVDPGRLCIEGGSAGGYTTLCALAFHDFFEAGSSYFGVSDLEALVKQTHKFESRYLHRLIAPYPQRQDLYRQRSPIYHVDQLSSPIILLQGMEDAIVPPNQAEIMVEALEAKGLPVACLTFEGEQHGFRRSENIKKALEGELYFYSKIFEFDLPESVDEIKIENLESYLEKRRWDRAEEEDSGKD